MSALEAIQAGLANAKDEFEHEITALKQKAEQEKAALVADYERQLQSLKDQLLASNIQVEVHKGLMNDAHAARATAEKITTTLLTQFATISKTFDDIRTFAMNVASSTANTVKTIEGESKNLPAEAAKAVDAAKVAIEHALNRNPTP